MALLSGASSSPAVFLREYLTVAGNSTSAVLAGETVRSRGRSRRCDSASIRSSDSAKKSVERRAWVFA